MEQTRHSLIPELISVQPKGQSSGNAGPNNQSRAINGTAALEKICSTRGPSKEQKRRKSHPSWATAPSIGADVTSCFGLLCSRTAHGQMFWIGSSRDINKRLIFVGMNAEQAPYLEVLAAHLCSFRVIIGSLGQEPASI